MPLPFWDSGVICLISSHLFKGNIKEVSILADSVVTERRIYKQGILVFRVIDVISSVKEFHSFIFRQLSITCVDQWIPERCIIVYV